MYAAHAEMLAFDKNMERGRLGAQNSSIRV
jgi:hypothetical protein